MNGLLDDKVAGQRQHVVPLSKLLGDVGGRQAAAATRPWVVGLSHDQFSDVSGMHPANCLAVYLVRARLEIDQKDQLLARCLLAGLGNR